MPHSRPYDADTLLESLLLHSHEDGAAITSQPEDTAAIFGQLQSMRGKTSTQTSLAIVGDEVHHLAMDDPRDYRNSGQPPWTAS